MARRSPESGERATRDGVGDAARGGGTMRLLQEGEQLASGGRTRDAVDRFRAAFLALDERATPELLFRVFNGLNRALGPVQTAAELDALLIEGRGRFRRLGRRDLEAACLLGQAISGLVGGRIQSGLSLARSAAALARSARAPAIEAQALLCLGQGCIRCGRLLEAERVLQRSRVAFKRAARPDGRHRVLAELAIVRWRRGDLLGAHRGFRRSLVLCRRASATAHELYVLVYLARFEHELGDPRAAARTAASARRIARAVGDARSALTIGADVGLYAVECGHPTLGLRAARAAERGMRAHGGPLLAEALGVVARAHLHVGRLSEAKAALAEATAIVAASSGPGERAQMQGRAASLHLCEAKVAFRGGDLAEARRLARRARSVLAPHGALDDLVDANILLVEIELARGAATLGRRELRAARSAVAPGSRVAPSEGLIDIMHARRARLLGDRHAAEAAVARARVRLRLGGADFDERVALGIEEATLLPEGAGRALSKLLSEARSRRLPWPRALLLLARGGVPGRAAGAAAADLDEAASIAGAHGFKLLEAEILAARASAARRIGRADSAPAWERAAAEGRVRCLSALAAPAPRSGPEGGGLERVAAERGLSRAEVEVLAALAAGHSNEEIARKLFVAVTTVRAHLRSIFKKLNVRSRLAAIVTIFGCLER